MCGDVAKNSIMGIYNYVVVMGLQCYCEKINDGIAETAIKEVTNLSLV